MKIVDCHVHVTQTGRWFHTSYDASLDRLMKEMDIAKIDKAVLLGIAGYIENEFIIKSVRSKPDRFWGMGSVHPNSPTALDEVKSFKDSGLVGVKLHPRLSGWSFDSPGILPLFEACKHLKLAVTVCSHIHRAEAPPSRPLHDEIAKLASLFPPVPIIIAHAGFHMPLQAGYVSSVHQNVWLDLSFSVTRFWKSSVRTDLEYMCEVMPHKILWGSDFPEVSIPEYLDKCRELWRNITPSNQQKIVSGNWQSIIDNLRS